MRQAVIFCASYGEIKRTLYLATRYPQDRPVTVVIPGMHDLFRFFQEVNEKALHHAIKLIYFEPYSPGRVKARGINKIFHIIPDIIRERRYLKEIYNKYFAEMEGCDVFFCSRGFSGYLFYLVKKLSRKNRLVNTSPSPPQIDPVSQYNPKNIADLASLIILKLIYGRDIALGELPHLKGFIYMTDRFMEKVVAEFIGWEEIEEMMKDFNYSRFRVFDTGNYSVIYFDDSLLEAGFLKSKELFQAELTEIFNILARHFPENEIARKYHPSYPGDKALVKIGDVLPDFIPAELLYDERVKIYISLCSYAIANVETGLAVSIVDLITFKDENNRNQLKEKLIRMSKSKILFPASLDEFEQILIDLKEQRI